MIAPTKRRPQAVHGTRTMYNKGCRCDGCRAASAEYIKAYAERNREKREQWKRDNPILVRAAKRTHRAKKLLTAGAQFESRIDYESLWTGQCGICKQSMDRKIERHDPLSPTIDHIVPLSKGGSHTTENLQWVHMGCNASKGANL